MSIYVCWYRYIRLLSAGIALREQSSAHLSTGHTAHLCHELALTLPSCQGSHHLPCGQSTNHVLLTFSNRNILTSWMTDRRFEHEESILARCAKSCVASFIESGQSYVYNGSSKETFLQKRAEENGEPSQVGCAENDESCALLFRLHAQHYGRIHANEDTILARTILNGSFEPPPPLNANPLVYTYKVGSKMEAFIRNIIFVHHHNSAAGNMHRVTLNRFSDLRPSEVLVERRVVDPASMWSEKARRLTEVVNTNADEDLVRSGRVPLFGSAMEGMAVLLSTSEEILQVAANFTIGHGSKNQLHYKSKKKSKKAKVTYDLYPKSIQLPPDAYLHSSEDGRFETPALDPRMDGSLLSIQRNKDYHSERHHYHTRRDDDDSMISDNRNVHLDAGAIDDDFATYLNWATTDNPDGVSVVHDAYDQVCLLADNGIYIYLSNEALSRDMIPLFIRVHADHAGRRPLLDL